MCNGITSQTADYDTHIALFICHVLPSNVRCYFYLFLLIKISETTLWAITFCSLGAFAKLRKAKINFVTIACLAVSMEHLDSHWRDFHEIWYLGVFRVSFEKIQMSFKSNKCNVYFTLRPIYIFNNVLQWEMFHAQVVEKNQPYIYISTALLSTWQSKNMKIKLWKTVRTKVGHPDPTIRRHCTFVTCLL